MFLSKNKYIQQINTIISYTSIILGCLFLGSVSLFAEKLQYPLQENWISQENKIVDYRNIASEGFVAISSKFTKRMTIKLNPNEENYIYLQSSKNIESLKVNGKPLDFHINKRTLGKLDSIIEHSFWVWQKQVNKRNSFNIDQEAISFYKKKLVKGDLNKCFTILPINSLVDLFKVKNEKVELTLELSFSQKTTDLCKTISPALWIMNEQGLKFFIKPSIDLSKRVFYNGIIKFDLINKKKYDMFLKSSLMKINLLNFLTDTTPHQAKLLIATKKKKYIVYVKPFYLKERSSSQAVDLGVLEGSNTTFLNGTKIGSFGDMSSPTTAFYDKRSIYDYDSGLLNINSFNFLMILSEGRSGLWPARHIFGSSFFGPATLIHQSYLHKNILDMVSITLYLMASFYFFLLFFRMPRYKEYLFFATLLMLMGVYFLLRQQIKYYLFEDAYLVKKIEYLALYGIGPAFNLFTYFFFVRVFSFTDRFFRLLLLINTSVQLVLLAIVIFMSNFIAMFHLFETYLIYTIIMTLVCNLFFIIRDTITFLIKKTVAWNKPKFIVTFVYKLDHFFEKKRIQANQKITRIQRFKGTIFFTEKKLKVRLRDIKIDSMLILLGSLILAICILHDISLLTGEISGTEIMWFGYGFALFLTGIAGILANRFVRIHKIADELREGLENKVEEKTHKLSQSLRRVSEMKVKQDGDYFLTALLIKPLKKNRSENGNVIIEYLIRQKKKFRFRKWKDEIGGDLCIADEITLRNESFSVFLHGDALGKSIQGAGGVLVLGSVSLSIIQRTKMSSRASDVTAEKWIKYAFIELQKVFEVFDGNMLISIFMGLVENSTGKVHYLNADHPNPILYRAGKANYLENSSVLAKLGVANIKKSLDVATFLMQENDVLISGTDLQDDLSAKTKSLNLKSTLAIVENAKANLIQVYRRLLRSYKIEDDLSLLRIEYKTGQQATTYLEGDRK